MMTKLSLNESCMLSDKGEKDHEPVNAQAQEKAFFVGPYPHWISVLAQHQAELLAQFLEKPS